MLNIEITLTEPWLDKYLVYITIQYTFCWLMIVEITKDKVQFLKFCQTDVELWYFKLWIMWGQIYNVLKYLWFTQSGCTDRGISKIGFVTIAHLFIYNG